MLKLEEYLREDGDPDIVGHLEIEIYVAKAIGEDKKVRLPLGPESKEITFKELGEFAFEYYLEKLKVEGSYGINYKIIEIED